MTHYNPEAARHLCRLLKIKEPTMKDELDITALVCKLGVYGEQLYKIAREDSKYE